MRLSTKNKEQIHVPGFTSSACDLNQVSQEFSELIFTVQYVGEICRRIFGMLNTRCRCVTVFTTRRIPPPVSGLPAKAI